MKSKKGKEKVTTKEEEEKEDKEGEETTDETAPLMCSINPPHLPLWGLSEHRKEGEFETPYKVRREKGDRSICKE